MTPNPYRAPLLTVPPLAAAATFQRRDRAIVAMSEPVPVPTAVAVPPADERRRQRVRRVRSGIWTALAGHGLALTLPLLPAALAGASGTVYTACIVVAQLLLAATVVGLGIARTVRRDGANSVGLAIGWIAGVPVAAVAGIAIMIALAAS
ncbi:hypothetical protein [Catellatospora paridis]|uniref:hypothetical protein n=1 Tax=Catellatospora paridis TaxID=1617086 RepID=UPI0012D3C468|nr:hypothetical protein [Catellatospora paridis]